MQQHEGADVTWFHRRFGPGAWAGMVPPQRLAWYLGGALGALLLLGAFYLVLHQSVARADQHWARALGAGTPARGCDAGRSLASADSCVNSAPAARMAASPR